MHKGSNICQTLRNSQNPMRCLEKQRSLYQLQFKTALFESSCPRSFSIGLVLGTQGDGVTIAHKLHPLDKFVGEKFQVAPYFIDREGERSTIQLDVV
jgi:hypothetical protein